jgi:hypothetical protein
MARYLCLIIRVRLDQGQMDRVAELLQLARSFAGDSPISDIDLRIQSSLGRIALAGGQTEEAFGRFEQARQMKIRAGLPEEAASLCSYQAMAETEALAGGEGQDVSPWSFDRS